MNFRCQSKDRSCWKELDDQIIYYQNDTNVYNYSKELRFMNVASGEILEYFTIAPKSLGLLKKYDSYLNIFIETQSSTLIARLYKNPLRIKISYRIFEENLYHFGPKYDFSHNILQILKHIRLIQLSRNKLIRKYNGNFEKQIPLDVIKGMVLRSFNLFNQKIKFCQNHVQKRFESILNLSLSDINQQYGAHKFKKIGNFIILKKEDKYSKQQCKELPVYYLSIDHLLKGDGDKGIIYLGQFQTLKLIKQFHNCLYAVIKIQSFYQVNEIRNGQLILIYQSCIVDELKKPILLPQNLIATNKNDYFNPQILRVDLQKNEFNKE